MKGKFFLFSLILLLFLSFSYKESYKSFKGFNKYTADFFFNKELFCGKEVLVPKLPEETIKELKESSLNNPELLPYLATSYIEALDFKNAENTYITYFNTKKDLNSLSMLLNFYHERGMFRKEIEYLLKGCDLKLKKEEKRDILNKAEEIVDSYFPQDLNLKNKIYKKEIEIFSKHDDFIKLSKVYLKKGLPLFREFKKITNDKWELLFANLEDLYNEKNFSEFYNNFYKNYSVNTPKYLKKYFFNKLSSSKDLIDERKSVEKKLFSNDLSFKDFSFLFSYLRVTFGDKNADQFLRYYIEECLNLNKTFTKEEKIELLKFSNGVGDDLYVIRILNSLLLNGNLTNNERVFAYTLLIEVLLNRDFAKNGFNISTFPFLENSVKGDNTFGTLNSIISLIFNNKDVKSDFEAFKSNSKNYFTLYLCDKLLLKIKNLNEEKYVDVLLPIVDRYNYVLNLKERIGYLKKILPLLKDENNRVKIYLKIARMYKSINYSKSSIKYYNLYFQNEKMDILNEDKSYSYWGIQSNISKFKENYFNIVDEYISLLLDLNRKDEVLTFLSNLLKKYPDNQNIYFKFLNILDRFKLIDREVETYDVVLNKFQKDTSLYAKAVRFFYRLKRYEKIKSITEDFIDKFNAQEISNFLSNNISYIENANDLKKFLYYYALSKFPLNKGFLDNYTYYFKDENIFFKYSLIYPEYSEKYFKYLSKNNSLDIFFNSVKQEKEGLLKDYFTTEYYLYRCEFEKGLGFAQNFLKNYYYLPEISKRYVTLLRSYSFKNDKYLNGAINSLKNYFLQKRSNYAPLIEIADIYFENGYLKEGKKALYDIVSSFKYNKDVYTKVATVFWDYYLNDDAIKVLLKGRKVLKDDTLFGYELGGIYESENDYKNAISAYVSSGLNEYNYTIFDRLNSILLDHPKLIPYFEKKVTDLILRKKDDSIFWNVKDFYDNYGDKNLSFDNFLKTFIKNCNDIKLLMNLDENIDMNNDIKMMCYGKIFKLRGGIYSLSNFEIFKRYLSILKNKDLNRAKLLVKGFYDKYFQIKEIADFSINFFKDVGDKVDLENVLSKSFNISVIDKFKKEYGLKLLKFYFRNGSYEKFLSLLKTLKGNFQKDTIFLDSLFKIEGEYLVKNGSENDILSMIKEYYKFTGNLSVDDRKSRRDEFLRNLLKNVFNKKKFSFLTYDVSRRLLLLNPEDEDTLKTAYYLSNNVGEKEKLFSYFKENFNRSPKDFRLAYILGDLYFYDMDIKNAEFFLKKSIEIRPEDETPYLKLIELYKNLKNGDEEILNVYISLYEATLKDDYLYKILDYSYNLKKNEIFSKYLKVYLGQYDGDYKRLNEARLYFSLGNYIKASDIAGKEIYKKIKIGDIENLGDFVDIFINCAERTGNYFLALRMVSKLYYYSYIKLSPEFQGVFESKLISLFNDFDNYCDENSYSELKTVENMFLTLSKTNNNFLRGDSYLMDAYFKLPTSTDFLSKINFIKNSSQDLVLSEYFKRGLFNKGIEISPRNYNGEDYFNFMKGIINKNIPLVLQVLSTKIRKENNKSFRKLYVKFLVRQKDFDPLLFMKSDNYYLTKREFLRYILENKLFMNVAQNVFDTLFQNKTPKVKYQRELLKYYISGDLKGIKDEMLNVLKISPLKNLKGIKFFPKDIYPNAKYTTYFGELLVKNGDDYGYKLIPAIVERVPSYQNFRKIYKFYKSVENVKKCDEIMKLLGEKLKKSFDLDFEKFTLHPDENIGKILKLAKKDSNFRYILAHRLTDVLNILKRYKITQNSPYFKLLKIIFFQLKGDETLIEFSKFLKSKGLSISLFLKGKDFYENYKISRLNRLLKLNLLSKEELLPILYSYLLKKGSIENKVMFYFYLKENGRDYSALLTSIKKELEKKPDENFQLDYYGNNYTFFYNKRFEHLNSTSYSELRDLINFMENPDGVKFSDELFSPFIKSLPISKFKSQYVNYFKNLFRDKILNGKVDSNDFVDIGKAYLLKGNLDEAVSNFKKGIYFSSNKDYTRSEILQILINFDFEKYVSFIENKILPYLLKSKGFDFLILKYYVKKNDKRAYDFISKILKNSEPDLKVKVINYLVDEIKKGNLNRLRILTLLKNRQDGFSKLFALKLLGYKDYDLGISKNYFFLREYYRMKFKEGLNDKDIKKCFDMFFDEPWFKFYVLKYWYDNKEYGKILGYIDYNLITPYVLSSGYYYNLDMFLSVRNLLRSEFRPVFDEIVYKALSYFSLKDVLRSYFKRILPDGYKYLKNREKNKNEEIVRFIMGEE